MANKDPRYNYEEARDRTDEVMRMIPRLNDKDSQIRRDLDLFKHPQALKCTHCGDFDHWRVLVDTRGDSGLMMLGCRCGVWYRAMEIRVPQMTDERAQGLGLWVPNKRQVMVPIDIEFELDE
jgi:hypothetical protein